jgi:microcystin-dependent protein
MPYIGQIKKFAFNQTPSSSKWLLCDGSVILISASVGTRALHFCIGTKYGGNGITTFGLPDLRPLGVSSGSRLNSANGTYYRGQLYLKYYVCIDDDADQPDFIDYLVPGGDI